MPDKYIENYKQRLQAYRKILKSQEQSFEVLGARVLYNFLERYGFRCYVAYGPYWPALKDIFLKQGLLTGTPYSDRDMAAEYCGATDEETIVMAEMFRDGYLSDTEREVYCYDGQKWSMDLFRQLKEDYDYHTDDDGNLRTNWNLFDPEMDQLASSNENHKDCNDKECRTNEIGKNNKQTCPLDQKTLDVIEKITEKYNGHWSHVMPEDDCGIENTACWVASVLSAMELLQTAGINLDDVITPESSARSALIYNFQWTKYESAANVSRLLDLKVNTLRDSSGAPVTPWSEAILFSLCSGPSLFYPLPWYILNEVLLKLKPNAASLIAETKDELQEFQFNFDHSIFYLETNGSLTNFWVDRWFLYRKLLNYSLGRQFEKILGGNSIIGEGSARQCLFGDTKISYIDFYGVDSEITSLDSADGVYPFTAAGVKVVFANNETLTLGASGHVVAVCNDVLEEEDAAGQCFHWTGKDHYIGHIEEERYSTHRLNPEKQGEQINNYSVSLKFSSNRLLTISRTIEYPSNPNKKVDHRLHCIIESTFDDGHYSHYWID